MTLIFRRVVKIATNDSYFRHDDLYIASAAAAIDDDHDD